jgi:hypothetical protein
MIASVQLPVVLPTLCLLLVANPSSASDLPDMTCKDKEVTLPPSTLAAQESASGDTYI